MKHIKTYEGIIGNNWFKIFSNKYIKRIVLNFDKLLNDPTLWTPEILIFLDIEKKSFHWSYINNNNICLNILKNDKHEWKYIEIIAETQWLEIRVDNNSKIDQIEYFESLLIKYGDLHNKSYDKFFNTYYLTLPNAEKVINELNVKDFMLSKNMSKFNI